MKKEKRRVCKRRGCSNVLKRRPSESLLRWKLRDTCSDPCRLFIAKRFYGFKPGWSGGI